MRFAPAEAGLLPEAAPCTETKAAILAALHPKTAEASLLPLLPVRREAGRVVVGQRLGVVLAAGVQPQPPRPVAERLLDRPPQEPLPQPLTDELRRQPEL